MKQTQKILVTGSSGFIGSNLIGELLQKGYTVYAISREKQNAKLFAAFSEYRPVTGRFYDPALLNNLKDETIDAVIHLAAIRGESPRPTSEYQQVNVAGTEAMLQFARKNNIPKFIFVSTVGVLGTIPKRQPAKADAPPNPDNKYHRSKWQAEQLVRRYHSRELQTLILRPTITYGPGDNGFIPKMIRMIKNKRFFYPVKPVNIHLLSVRALSALLARVAAMKSLNGETYLVADRSPVPLRVLVDFISQQCSGKNYPAVFRWPDFTFQLGQKMLTLVGNHQLVTSLRLISADWTYDISETIRQLDYRPLDTLSEMHEIFDQLDCL